MGPSNELKNFYDKSVEKGVLQPLASYKECKIFCFRVSGRGVLGDIYRQN